MHVAQTETPCTVASPYTSDTLMRNTFDSAKGIAFSNVAGTLHIDQGWRTTDGTIHWDLDTSIAVTANTGANVSVELVAPYWRVRFVPNSDTATLRIFVAATATGYIGG